MRKKVMEEAAQTGEFAHFAQFGVGKRGVVLIIEGEKIQKHADVARGNGREVFARPGIWRSIGKSRDFAVQIKAELLQIARVGKARQRLCGRLNGAHVIHANHRQFAQKLAYAQRDLLRALL